VTHFASITGARGPFRLRPLETANLAALLLLTMLTLGLYPRLPEAGGLLLRFALMGAAVAFVIALVQRPARVPPAIRWFLDFYPAAFIPLIFESLGPLISTARGNPRDNLLIAADRILFGVDVTVWLERLVRPWVNDVFYLFYSSYYFISLVLGFWLWARDRATARRFIFTLAIVYYVSYAGYFTIPALGPRTALAEAQRVSIQTTPISRAINDTINRLEQTKLDVFPSGHTMVAVGVLLIAWKRARRLFWILLPIAVGLILSTVYCRYHYVVDVLAGAALAVATVPLGDWLYDRMVGREA
jgi:membrane-associated phospholipid phosphatase